MMSPSPTTWLTTRLTVRRGTRIIAVVTAALGAGACRGGHDAARDARAAERQEVRRAAQEAARLATAGDTGRGTRRGAARDTGPHFSVDIHDARGLTRAGDPPLGPGDVRIASTDGGMILSLVGDTVRMRLGDSATAKMRRAVDTSGAPASGFGGFVSSTVKAAVGGALSEVAHFAVLLPVREIKELRYENGELHFGTGVRAGGRKGTSGNARFAPADAERFIAAVRARQRAPGIGG